MFRKLSRRLGSRRDETPAPPRSPEFLCIDARRHDRAREPAPKPRRSWEHSDEQSFYTNRRLEALQLEPIIAPTLTRMAPTITTREVLQPPPLRINKVGPLQPPPPVFIPGERRHTNAVILSRPAQGITEPPAPQGPDPFEDLDTFNELQITDFPKRPILRRQAVSYRTQRDLPLRVQAVRRAHQEEFSRRLAERSAPFTPPPRRKSGPEVSQLPQRAPDPTRPNWELTHNVRPPRPLSPQSALRRARSEAQLYQVPQRKSSRHRSPVPDVPLLGPGESDVDWYIQSAQDLWAFPSPPGL